jgi:RimJ/RimL family protein N-acetyltransferase
MFLNSERLRLRAPEREHIDGFLRWLNNPEIYRFIQRYKPLGRIEEEELIANAHKRPEDVLFAIEAKSEGGGIPIGCCGLHRISLPNRSAELGIAIGESEYQGRGYGREAMNLLCSYGFQMLNLNRIGLSVYEYNARAIRCYERVGFKHEGRKREARFWDGRHWDILEMSILAREWRERLQAEVPSAAVCQT